jgi:nitrate reductase NapAB chaperone NapD
VFIISRGAGGLVNSNPEYKKQLDEQLNRLAQKFKLPSSEIVGKLEVAFEKANVESSVNTLLEGKTLDELIVEEKKA